MKDNDCGTKGKGRLVLWNQKRKKFVSKKLPKNNSTGFKPETPWLVQKQQAFKPLQHFALCDKWGKQNLNILALSHEQKSPSAPSPAPEDSWQMQLRCRCLCHRRREGCYCPADTGERGRAKKPPQTPPLLPRMGNEANVDTGKGASIGGLRCSQHRNCWGGESPEICWPENSPYFFFHLLHASGRRCSLPFTFFFPLAF